MYIILWRIDSFAPQKYGISWHCTFYLYTVYALLLAPKRNLCCLLGVLKVLQVCHSESVPRRWFFTSTHRHSQLSCIRNPRLVFPSKSTLFNMLSLYRRDWTINLWYLHQMTLVINLLKPTSHVMHQQFNIQQLYVLPALYLCVLYLFENKQRRVPLTA